MKDEIMVNISGVSKKYCRSLKLSMIYGLSDIVGQFYNGNSIAGTLRDGEFWSLQNISINVRRGECLALIGPNGSGKSTLMKIVSGIYNPDAGNVFVNGRICSLIEVGAGFHPLLTGYENIYLNGSILGMSQKEIDSVYDDIVEFSGIREFINMPVKSYSSGMFVRLGFSIAVHAKPDVLLIDEVLAVGDAGFRARCYNRIHEMINNTAIIFVSHSMHQIHRIATKTMVLENGISVYKGDVIQGISTYNRIFSTDKIMQRHGSNEIRVENIKINHVENKIEYGKLFRFTCSLASDIDEDNVLLSLIFRDMNDDAVLEINGLTEIPEKLIHVKAGTKTGLVIELERLTLNPGLYNLNILLASKNKIRHYDWLKNYTQLEVIGNKLSTAPVQIPSIWQIMPDIQHE